MNGKKKYNFLRKSKVYKEITKNIQFKKSRNKPYDFFSVKRMNFIALIVWCMLIIGIVDAVVKEHNIVSGHLCDPNVKQYSGYIKVNEKANLFFWFFESRNHPKTSPLTLWLNGGPPCSSMMGLFRALGPCRSLAGGSDVKVHPESWNEVSNMLFLDQPAETGFSFGDEFSTTKTSNQTSQDLYIFLQKFFEEFPEYSTLDFHIFGESYAGHYIPAIAKLINENNILIESNKIKAIKINLRSIGIGNGWIDPIINHKSYPDFLEFNSYGPLLNSSVLAAMRSTFLECERLINQCYITENATDCASATGFCEYNYRALFIEIAGKSQNDIRASETSHTLPPEDYMLYLAKPEVMADIGAQKNYENCSMALMFKFIYSGDYNFSYKTVIEYLLDRGFPVLLYYGDADYKCNWFSGRELVKRLNWSHKYGFTNTPIKQWVVGNHPAGEIISFDKLTFIRIYEAGHEVPFYQPKNSLDMFSKWINNEKLSTIN